MDNFFDNVARIIEKARKHVSRSVDLTMCITYFEIGRMIVEEEQEGEARAKYGSELLAELSQFLGKKFGSGFSETNLRNSRKFYQIYSPSIQQAMSAELENQKGQTLSDEFKNDKKLQKLQLLPIESYPFRLNWSHYLILMRIKNEQERRFYEIEAINQHWTYRHLQRQYGSSLYERLALSRNKDEIMRLAN